MDDKERQDGYWTVGDLSRYLNLGRTKSYELLRTGQIRSVVIGRARRIDPHDVKEWAERNKIGHEE